VVNDVAKEIKPDEVPDRPRPAGAHELAERECSALDKPLDSSLAW
jgi:hypothetical protein